MTRDHLRLPNLELTDIEGYYSDHDSLRDSVFQVTRVVWETHLVNFCRCSIPFSGSYKMYTKTNNTPSIGLSLPPK